MEGLTSVTYSEDGVISTGAPASTSSKHDLPRRDSRVSAGGFEDPLEPHDVMLEKLEGEKKTPGLSLKKKASFLLPRKRANSKNSDTVAMTARAGKEEATDTPGSTRNVGRDEWSTSPDAETPTGGLASGGMMKSMGRSTSTYFARNNFGRKRMLDNTDFPHLTSRQANKLLCKTLSGLAEEYTCSDTLARATCRRLLTPDSLALFLVVIVLVINFVLSKEYNAVGSLVTAIVLFVFTIGNGMLEGRECVLQGKERIDKLNLIVNSLERSKGVFADSSRPVPSMPSASVVVMSVLRDSQWITLPPSLLVQGDVVEMRLGDTAPGDMRSLQSEQVVRLKRGSSYDTPLRCSCMKEHDKEKGFGLPLHAMEMSPPHELGEDKVLEDGVLLEDSSTSEGKAENVHVAGARRLASGSESEGHTHNHEGLASALGARCYFKMEETPIRSSIIAGLKMPPNTILLARKTEKREPGARPLTSFATFTSIVSARIQVLHGATIVVGIVVNTLWFFLGGTSVVEEWYHDLIVRPMFLMLPLLPLAIPSMLVLVNAVTTAHLLALFEAIQGPEGLALMDLSDSMSSDSEDSLSDTSLGNSVTSDRFRHHVRAFFSGKTTGLARTTSLVHVLGTVSVLCCTDTQGILSRPMPVVNKVLLPKSSGFITLSMSKRSPAGTDLDESVLGERVGGMRFNDVNWEQHLSALKPIGLTGLLSSSCLPVSVNGVVDDHLRLQRSIQGRFDFSFSGRVCTCPLAHEIGFSEGVVSDYPILKEVHVVSPLMTEALPVEEMARAPSFMCSFVVYAKDNGLQLMTRGTVDVVLEHCTEFFDGETICEMTPALREEILTESMKWGAKFCTGVAYRPLRKETTERLWADDEPYMLLEKREIGYARVPAPKDKESPSNDARRHEAARAAEYVVNDQIFLGMVDQAWLPKDGMFQMVEDMNAAGIRFVMFSKENERHAKQFASALGLDTDFNTCISLRDPTKSVDVDLRPDFEIKARLPRGVAEIRPHIKNKDNVPLLVPIFCDSSAGAEREVIQIFQEHGDVVCSFGSALNFYNTESFAQADVAVTFQPGTQRVCKRTSRSLRSMPSTSDRLNDIFTGVMTSRSCSSALTSLCAPLMARRDTNAATVGLMMKESRRLLANTQQALTWIVAGSSFVVAVLFFSMLAGVPDVLLGYQVVWLCLVVVPLQSMPMLFTHGDPNIMKILAAKNDGRVRFLGREIRRYLLRLIPTSIVCVILFGCVLSLFYTNLDPTGKIVTPWTIDRSKYEASALKSAEIYARALTLVALVFYMGVMACGYVHIRESVRQLNNRAMLAAVSICVLLQCGISIWEIRSAPVRMSWSAAPGWLIVPAVVWAVPIVVVDEFAKRKMRYNFKRRQTRIELELGTRLGMHSPV